MATLPSNEDGRRLKRTLMNSIEELADELRLSLPEHFFVMRRQVANGER